MGRVLRAFEERLAPVGRVPPAERNLPEQAAIDRLSAAKRAAAESDN